MQSHIQDIGIVLMMLNIFPCQADAWSFFGDSSVRAVDSNASRVLGSEKESEKYIAGMGLSSFTNFQPPSHDTPPSRCSCSKLNIKRPQLNKISMLFQVTFFDLQKHAK